ncbi:hypothetical protein [Novosphingobium humi]|uniref:Uncharacterized protein n=1 Tax=Novosphingobium humi TaxID=2282397 RepID=A0ABY7U1C5_9SPHN|nr:hypothetical protein [Novosphingobium humi]WCT79116.1 hypothetical protein PQ457_19070 [Novosphingobium humi]
MTRTTKTVTPALIDDLALIGRCCRHPGEGTQDYLVRLVGFLRDENDRLDRDLEVADGLIAKMLRDAEHIPLVGTIVQTCCGIAPLILPAIWFGGFFIACALWVGLVYMAPVFSQMALNFYLRMPWPAARPAEGRKP